MGTGLSPREILLNLDRPNHFGAFCGAFWRNLLIRCMQEFDRNSSTMCNTSQAEQKSYKAKVDSWVEITHVAQVSAVEFEHLTLTPWMDFGQRAPLNWHVENRAEITFERKETATLFQRLPPHFRSHPTQIWHWRHGPTAADIRNSKWRPPKPEVKITFERK